MEGLGAERRVGRGGPGRRQGGNGGVHGLRHVLRPDGRGQDLHARQRDGGPAGHHGADVQPHLPDGGGGQERKVRGQRRLCADLPGRALGPAQPRGPSRAARGPEGGCLRVRLRVGAHRRRGRRDRGAAPRLGEPQDGVHQDERGLEPLARGAHDLHLRQGRTAHPQRQALPRRPGRLRAREEVGRRGQRLRRGQGHQPVAHHPGQMHRDPRVQQEGAAAVSRE
mmetsp:Transcript_16994/g.40440  ORF Transcript_16994/g.40440 Transcript_16994/m.40440 type:complete len:224 (-) Transcript_16994:845-1516(-)